MLRMRPDHRVDESRAQDAHEPGQADDFDPSVPKAGVDRRFEPRLAGNTPKVDRLRRNPQAPRDLDSRRAGPVRENKRDLG